ncbi:hypothetical protein ACFSKU_00765 [Pontibacter silvestris]|uniref:Lipoprotein n=1 Tax=Pontibacter silvestris TaxID=2305183 RepID=A0ABW4WT78_9BACT|nr:hypothetical protein [Pontibacter silvestris]MCC9136140.1 hypothetical protein [Pontibacter silvestris]
MKKILILSAIILGLGTTSCKTYCPAYNYAKQDNGVKAKVPAPATSLEQVKS